VVAAIVGAAAIVSYGGWQLYRSVKRTSRECVQAEQVLITKLADYARVARDLKRGFATDAPLYVAGAAASGRTLVKLVDHYNGPAGDLLANDSRYRAALSGCFWSADAIDRRFGPALRDRAKLHQQFLVLIDDEFRMKAAQQYKDNRALLREGREDQVPARVEAFFSPYQNLLRMIEPELAALEQEVIQLKAR
jgi:hypothetical protein